MFTQKSTFWNCLKQNELQNGEQSKLLKPKKKEKMMKDNHYLPIKFSLELRDRMHLKQILPQSFDKKLQKINIIQWNRLMSRFRQIRKFVHRKFKELRQ